jgi:hypothetical protein
MALTITRDAVSDATRAALHACEGQMSRDDIARALGYKNTGMIRQALTGSCLMGTVQTIRLARLARAAGSPDLARLLASDASDLAALCDGDILDQIAEVMAETGAGTSAWQGGDWRAARRSALAGIRALRILLAEIDQAEAAERAAVEAARAARRPRKRFDYASA